MSDVKIGPAFPVTAGNQVYATGMTLRDWIAGQCIAASFGRSEEALDLHRGETVQDTLVRHWSDVALAAYCAADAMIAAREAGQ